YVILSNIIDNAGTLLKLNSIIWKIIKINKEPIAIAKGKFLVYWLPVSNISVNLRLIIIITKRNRTAIAPTYTIIYEIPTKFTPIKIKYKAACTKVEIKKITEITGFLEVIENTLESKVPKAKRFINKF